MYGVEVTVHQIDGISGVRCCRTQVLVFCVTYNLYRIYLYTSSLEMLQLLGRVGGTVTHLYCRIIGAGCSTV